MSNKNKDLLGDEYFIAKINSQRDVYGNIISPSIDDCTVVYDGLDLADIPTEYKGTTYGTTCVSLGKLCEDIYTNCMICGEPVNIDSVEFRQPIVYKICDKCKEVILELRKKEGE